MATTTVPNSVQLRAVRGDDRATRRSRPARTLAVALVVTVLAATIASVAALALRPTAVSEQIAVDVARGHQLNDDVPTSFGIVAAEFVRQLNGLTTRSLAGASHGVSGLVSSDNAAIQVSVAITNRTDAPINYTADQFSLRVTRNGRTSTQTVQGGDLPDTRVFPHAGIEGHLTFVVPRRDADLELLFRDPGRAGPIVIDLGPADFKAPRGDTEHIH